MNFPSILGPRSAGSGQDSPGSAPEFLTDLNLDQVIAAITVGKEEYRLLPFFHRPLPDVAGIEFRHEILQDLEQPRLFDDIVAFAASLRTMRAHLVQAEKLHYRYQKERWFLDAVIIYCDAVARLASDLAAADLTASGLSIFSAYVTEYAASDAFTRLRTQANSLAAALASIHYNVIVRGGDVEVRKYEGESNYGAEVEATFRKFQQGASRSFTFTLSDPPEMNHIEAQILDQVVKLYPEIFAELSGFVITSRSFLDPGVGTFDREIQFYLSYLEYIAPMKAAGAIFCYPRIVRTSKEIWSVGSFDLALAGNLIRQQTLPVCNDFRLEGPERIIIVSGPNQGGKTTFARTFGQLHYLASLGLPVPGKAAQLFLPDRIFTHFEREESIVTLHGKLQDDLVRIHAILEEATPDSLIIMNEIFTSTTFRDALALSKKVAAQIMRLDALCVWVTFLDELASLGPQTVSMVSTVVPGNPSERTFRIVRRPADGLAYALSIAEKYRLTYDMIRERLRS